MNKDADKHVTIAEIARRAGVSTATVSYVLSGRKDVKVASKTSERILALCRELGYEKGANRERGMQKKQVTIDDIAREAGVSTATVSYIINDRKDVKISDETRRKVLQICNLRQYAPSPIARLLAGKKSRLVGICAPQSPFVCRNAEYYGLICALRSALQKNGYGTVLLSPEEVQEARFQESPEGILCIDLTEEEFYTLKESCFVPIVAIDMLVPDPLFFKAYTDYGAVFAAARELLDCGRILYVTQPCRNRPYLEQLTRALGEDALLLAENASELRQALLSRTEDAVLFSHPLLAQLCSDALHARRAAVVCDETLCKSDLPCVRLRIAEKAEHAVSMLQSAISREESAPHTFLLAPHSHP